MAEVERELFGRTRIGYGKASSGTPRFRSPSPGTVPEKEPNLGLVTRRGEPSGGTGRCLRRT